MPPPKKKAAKKAEKKSAGHHHDKHHLANDQRRAFEHMGRATILRLASKSSPTDAIAELTTLPAPHEGTHPLTVTFKDAHGRVASDEIRLAAGKRTERKREESDQDNALQAWPGHGVLGTQLGPNKNGKKW